MITELRKAIEKAERLPEADQKIIAELILDEIHWNAALNDSQPELNSLAQEALEEYKKGKTKPLDL
jgi:hypothetical protein